EAQRMGNRGLEVHRDRPLGLVARDGYVLVPREAADFDRYFFLTHADPPSATFEHHFTQGDNLAATASSAGLSGIRCPAVIGSPGVASRPETASPKGEAFFCEVGLILPTMLDFSTSRCADGGSVANARFPAVPASSLACRG